MKLMDLIQELIETSADDDSTPVVVQGQIEDVIVSGMIKSVDVQQDADGCQTVYLELDSDLSRLQNVHCSSCDGHSC